MDRRQEGSEHKDPRDGISGLKSRLVVCVVLGGAVFFAGRSVMNPGLEWRLLALAALAFVLSPFNFEVRWRGGGASIPLAGWHSALFAGAITLGPFGAALPAAFYGSSRIIFGRGGSRPVGHVVYAIIKPVVACSLASLAYVLAGGNEWRPQAVDSFLPVMIAGSVYVIAGMALTVPGRERADNAAGGSIAATLPAAWALTLLGGYTLAVLYAVAPTYVLICPCAALGLAGFALRERKAREGSAALEPAAAQAVPNKADETNLFVDPVSGLATQRYLDMFLTRELSRATRAGKMLSIAVFDIDEAKKLAAAFGHEAVEEVITALGGRLKDSVREYDLVARHSSHGLLIVLPEVSAEEAHEVVIRLHNQVTSQPVNGRDISASVGIATYPEHGSTAQELINASHRVLNHGRFMGPNRVHVSERLERAG